MLPGGSAFSGFVGTGIIATILKVYIATSRSQKDAFQQGNITSTCVSIPKPKKPPNGDL